MAKKFLSPLNLLNLTSDPGTAAEGDFYWNSSTNKLRIYFDGAWSNIDALPSQTGNSGEFLVTNGTSASWSNTITANAANTQALIVKGITSQSADIQQWQDSGGTTQGYVVAGGNQIYFPGIFASYNMQANSGGAAVVPLIVKGFASQSANLQQWQNSAGSVLSYVRSDGGIYAISASDNRLYNLGIGGSSNGISWLYVTPQNANEKPVVIRGAGSQSANLTEWQDSAGTAQTVIASGGRIQSKQRLSIGWDPASAVVTAHSNFHNDFDAARIVMLVRGATSQSANLQEWQNSTPSTVASVSPAGNITAAQFIRTGGTSSQFLKADGSVDSNTYLTANQSITLSGDVTGSGTTAITTTLANSGVVAGTYNDSSVAVRPFTVDAKGRITSIGTAVTITPDWSNIASKPTTLSGFGITDAIDTSATAQTKSGNLTAAQFIKSGGTSSQFLKADGSSDSNTYLTTSTASSTYAPLASPALTGIPTAPTAAVDTNTTQLATTAYVIGQGYLKSSTASSTYAPIASPTFTGTVTLPGAPTSALHAATKQYVDDVTSGLNFHAAVKYATTAALGTTGNLVGGTITTTYNNGTSGVGATLTIATSSNWTDILIDGQSLTAGDRILIKDQAAGLQNGIYTVTTLGSVGNTTSFVFTRATDADNSPSGEMATGDFTFVQAGTTNGGFGYINNTSGAITIGTTAISYTIFNTGQSVVAGDGIIESPTPGTIAVDSTVVRNNANQSISGTLTANSFIPSSSTVPTNGIYLPSANTLAFATNSSGNRIVINSTGNIGIGNTPTTGFSLDVKKNITGSINSYGVISIGQIQSDVTSSAIMIATYPSTQATTFTLNNIQHFRASQGTFGANSSVSTQYGYYLDNSLTGATNNYGFYGNMPSGTGRWNLYMGGGAANYIGGQTTIGSNSLTLGSGSVAQQFGVVSTATTNIGIVVRGAASQTGDLTQWQNSAGTVLSGISAVGYGFFGTTGAASAAITAKAPLDNFMGIIVRPFSASQTANLQEWQNNSGTAVATMSASGAFTAITKSFDIPHPTKENMRLRYGSLEGPENGVYVRGRSKQDYIALPDHWKGLVDEDTITVNITPVGKKQDIYVDSIEDNRIYLGGKIKEYFFTVYGERKDVDKLIVEY